MLCWFPSATLGVVVLGVGVKASIQVLIDVMYCMPFNIMLMLCRIGLSKVPWYMQVRHLAFGVWGLLSDQTNQIKSNQSVPMGLGLIDINGRSMEFMQLARELRSRANS